MEKNFKLIIEYDGTGYHGWQRQASNKTIQAEVEEALARVTRRSIVVTGAGRTDAGVHALAQAANFHCETRLSPREVQNALNSLLPKDIVIKACSETPFEFHSRFDAKGKIYRYRIYNHSVPSALLRNHSWHIQRKLDVGVMEEAAKHLPGIHDFAAFQGQGSDVKNTVRQIFQADFKCKNHRIDFEIRGSGFLRYMVRNIIGTLVEIGMGKRSSEDFHEILTSGDRSRAGVTAPARGLFLVEVTY